LTTFLQPSRAFANSFVPRTGHTSKKTGVDIFLGNLPVSLTARTLKSAIAAKYDGEFTGPRIVFNREEKRSLGYGYMTVPTADIASSAVQQLSGLEFDGKVVKVDVTREKRIVRAAYFGNLSMEVTEENIKALVEERFGKESVVKVRLPKDVDGNSRGFGHVEFTSNALREQCIAELDGIEMGGRPIKVDKAVLKSRLPVVCINNIAYDVTQQNLEEMFDDLVGHGNYADVKLHFDRVTGYPRGFAHVTFTTMKYANQALDELSGIEMLGRPLRAQLVDRQRKPPAGSADSADNSE